MHRYMLLILTAIACLNGCREPVKPISMSSGKRGKHVYKEVDVNQVHILQNKKAKELIDAAQHTAIATIPALEQKIDVEHLTIDEIASDFTWTSDMPVPLHAKQKRDASIATPETYQVDYTIAESKEDIQKFYIEQMELHGWHCWWQAVSEEVLMIFKKPSKHCAISIRPASRNKRHVVVLQKVV